MIPVRRANYLQRNNVHILRLRSNTIRLQPSRALLLGLAFLISNPTSLMAATKNTKSSSVGMGFDPVAIVEAADRIRFPKDAFQVGVKVTNMVPGKNPDERQYQILSKGSANTVVRTMKPASEAGQIMLMRERDLWVFLPSVSQPVRMPLSQKLTGQVANGDLARANFTGDYTPKRIRADQIDGKSYAVLELTAVDRAVTYQKVIYWVDEKSMRPFKAEFYTISGRLMKTCLYRDFKQMEGAIRPTKLVMQDALKKGEYSEMVYAGMKRRALADKIFTKDYLKKLQR